MTDDDTQIVVLRLTAHQIEALSGGPKDGSTTRIYASIALREMALDALPKGYEVRTP